MKRYILLRSNRESGPYTLRELKTIGISSKDLIWIEGESTSWQYPAEFEELTPIAANGILIPLQGAPEKAAYEETAQPATTPSPTVLEIPATHRQKPVGDAVDYNQYLLDDKEEEFHWEPKKRRQILRDYTSSLFGLGVLLIGVMMCAFVVKKLVDQFEVDPYVASAQAIEISKETLPPSNSANAAKTTKQASVLPAAEIPANTVVETTPVEVVPVEKKPAVRKTIVDTPKPEQNLAMEANGSPETTEAMKGPETDPGEEKKEAPVEKAAPNLGVSANEYKVGVFGGISDLELSVNNPSSTQVGKATIEVEFLKPNGSVVKTQSLTVEHLSPGSTKKIAVPSSGRGVKVRFRVLNVETE